MITSKQILRLRENIEFVQRASDELILALNEYSLNINNLNHTAKNKLKDRLIHLEVLSRRLYGKALRARIGLGEII